MDLNELKAAIRQLVAVTESSAPVLSCYVDLEGGWHTYRDALDERIRVLRLTLDIEEREAFEMGLGQIEAYLGTAVAGGTKGLAIFSRAIDRPLLHALHFGVPLPNRLSIAALPSIYHLVQLKDVYHRYIVLIVTEEHARILEVDVGSTTRSLWAERPELRKRVGRVWSQEHYQNHRRDRGNRFIKEKIRVLDRIVSGRGHSHLVLAGSAGVVARLRQRLPKRLRAMLVDILPASSRDRDEDVVGATLASFIHHEQEESMLTAARLKDELRRGGLAVSGTDAALRALLRRQVDVLVIGEGYAAPGGWTCGECGAVESLDGLRQPAACPRCGDGRVRATDLREEMVRLAEEQEAETEIVRESDVLLELGGVGCLLRYWTAEDRLEGRPRTPPQAAEVAS